MYGELNCHLVWAKCKIGEETTLYKYCQFGSIWMVKPSYPRKGAVIKFLSKPFTIKDFKVREALIN